MTSSEPTTRPPAVADDSRSGLAMFLIFTVAVLTSTGAVALLAVVGGWWMLGVAFAVHVVMTAVVVLTILYVMAGRTAPIADHDRQLPVHDRRLEGRLQTRAKAGESAINTLRLERAPRAPRTTLETTGLSPSPPKGLEGVTNPAASLVVCSRNSGGLVPQTVSVSCSPRIAASEPSESRVRSSVSPAES